MHFQPVENMADDEHITRAEGGYQADAATSNDALDDVLGSGPSSPLEYYEAPGAHPSDIRRLQSEHATAGYREGLTVSKESSIQAGFDEGFSLGASIGLKAGQLLGALEGIAGAVRVLESDAAKHALELEREAQRELSTAEIFSPAYWNEDGNWKFDVGREDVVFADVADAHPLVRKWAAVVDEQVALWGIDRSVLDDETGQRLEAIVDEPVASSAMPVAKKPLDW